MFSYFAYGLNIKSAIPLPELSVHESAMADVTIRYGQVNYEPDVSKPLSWYCVDPLTIYLCSNKAGKFLIKSGQQIIIEPLTDVDEQSLRLLILGPAFGILLYQRNLLMLHASAVSIGGESIAFLGESGQGKSTTAAAFYAHGYDVVADDLLAVDTSQSGVPHVLPGFAQLKLWPEIITFLGEAPETMPRVHSSIDKRARRISEGFPSLPLPLKRLYVLADSENIEVDLLPPQEALIELVRHSYVRRLVHSIKDSTHLPKCASLIQKVSVCRLNRPRSLNRLSELVRVVERDMANSVNE